MCEVLDALRDAIDRAGVTRYRICKDLDLDQGQMSKFMQGQVGFALPVLERIAHYLGFEIALRPVRRKEKR
jgi:hypothetical protein